MVWQKGDSGQDVDCWNEGSGEVCPAEEVFQDEMVKELTGQIWDRLSKWILKSSRKTGWLGICRKSVSRVPGSSVNEEELRRGNIMVTVEGGRWFGSPKGSLDFRGLFLHVEDEY